MFEPIWKNDKVSDDFASDCDVAASALTALFDGEADAAQARRARLHLVVCPQCAQMWRTWDRTRALLQTPVPVPAGLRLRIVLACRLAALRSPRIRRNSGVLFEPPTGLHAAILQRTTRADSVQPAPRVFAPFSGGQRFGQRFGMRYVAASAVPATLLWLALVSPSRQAPAPIAAPRDDSASARNIDVTQSRTPLNIARRVTTPRRSSAVPATSRRVAPTAISQDSQSGKANPAPVSLPIIQARWSNEDVRSERHIAPREERDSFRESRTNFVARPTLIETSMPRLVVSIENREASPANIARAVIPVKVAATSAVRAALHPAVRSQPRVTVARVSLIRASLTPMSMADLPVASVSRAMLRPEPREDAIEDRAEPLNDAASPRDLAATRPDAVRHVIDDFRESLQDENESDAAVS